MAIVAAVSAVIPPIQAMSVEAHAVLSKRKKQRQSPRRKKRRFAPKLRS
jgi:hypothetical protein